MTNLISHPDDWTTDPGTGKQYRVVRYEFPNHTESQRICAENGGFLPEPRSQEENEFLRDFTINTFWLGAVRSSGDRFVWLSDGTDLDYNNWHQDQSNLGKDCGYRFYDTDVWGTRHCSFLCNYCGPSKPVCQRNVGKFSCYFCQ